MLSLRGKKTIGDALYDVRADLSRSQKTIGDTVHDVRDDLSRSQRNVQDALRDATADLAHVAKTDMTYIQFYPLLRDKKGY